MIDDAMRRSFLASFPASVALTVLATRPTLYLEASHERGNLTLVALEAASAAPAAIADSNVVVDDLADVGDPETLLAAIRGAAPRSRLFGLASNAAHYGTLGRFLGGEPFAFASALVRPDLERVFERARWRAIDISPIVDRGAPGTAGQLRAAGVVFDAGTLEVAERLRTAGYLVVADPQ